MKKIVKVISLVVLITMLLSTLISCAGTAGLALYGSQTRAAKLLELIDETLSEADSYTLTTTSKIFGYAETENIVMTHTQNVHMSGLKGDSPLISIYSLTDYDYSTPTLNSQLKITEGYQDGLHYRTVSQNDFTSSLVSGISFDKMLEHTIGSDSTVSYKLDDLSSERGGDGEWVVKISDKDSVMVSSLSYDVATLTPGFYVEGLEITITIKEDLSGWKTHTDYIFKKADDGSEVAPITPIATVDSEYSVINGTTVDRVDLSNFKGCEDLALPARLDRDISNILFAKSGHIDTDIIHRAVVRGEKASVKEEDSITFSTKDGKLYYNITATYNRQIISLNYSNGVKSQGDQSVSSSDSAERSWLRQLITGNIFNPLYVTGIAASEDDPNTYVIDIYLSPAQIEALTVGDRRFTRGYATVTVTYDDEGLREMHSYLKAYAVGVSGGSSYELTVDTVFDKVEN